MIVFFEFHETNPKVQRNRVFLIKVFKTTSYLGR